MDKTETEVDIKYLQKKDLAPKEIHEQMVQRLAENCPFYATVNNRAAEFKQGRDST